MFPLDEGFADKAIATIRAAGAGLTALSSGTSIKDAALGAFIKSEIESKVAAKREANARKAPVMATELYNKWVEFSITNSSPGFDVQITQNFIKWVIRVFDRQQFVGELVSKSQFSPNKWGNKIEIGNAVKFLTELCLRHLEEELKDNKAQTSTTKELAKVLLASWKKYASGLIAKNKNAKVDIGAFRSWIKQQTIYTNPKLPAAYKTAADPYINALNDMQLPSIEKLTTELVGLMATHYAQ